MAPTDNQRSLVISKLTPSAQVLYRALDEAIKQSAGKPDALKIVIELSEKLGGRTFTFLLALWHEELKEILISSQTTNQACQ